MKKFILAAIALTVLYAPKSLSQSPYQLKTGLELKLGGLALGTGGAAVYFLNKTEPLTTTQIGQLNTQSIGSFDRWATRQYSAPARRWSDALLFGAHLLPGMIQLLDKPVRNDFFTVATLYAEASVLNLALTNLVKNTTRRTRPFLYNPAAPLSEKTTLGARQSFYSGHTSHTATVCFLAASVYADYHPDSRWKPLIWGAAAAIPAATGLLRIKAGKHFPTDVIAGYLAGAAVGWVIPRLHRVRR